MHITLETDYAIRIARYLAIENKVATAKAIAEATNITPGITFKILRKLSTAGIVKSFKGASGGYLMAGDSSKINLKELLETLEGPYYISRCLNSASECSFGLDCNCKAQNVFDTASQMVRDYFETVTLDNLI